MPGHRRRIGACRCAHVSGGRLFGRLWLSIPHCSLGRFAYRLNSQCSRWRRRWPKYVLSPPSGRPGGVDRVGSIRRKTTTASPRGAAAQRRKVSRATHEDAGPTIAGRARTQPLRAHSLPTWGRRRPRVRSSAAGSGARGRTGGRVGGGCAGRSDRTPCGSSAATRGPNHRGPATPRGRRRTHVRRPRRPARGSSRVRPTALAVLHRIGVATSDPEMGPR